MNKPFCFFQAAVSLKQARLEVSLGFENDRLLLLLGLTLSLSVCGDLWRRVENDFDLSKPLINEVRAVGTEIFMMNKRNSALENTN